MLSQSRADLHVHSKFSDRPAEWLLRRVGAPECFVQPLDVYRRAKQQGMDFVTISDHNSIGGVLEIAHLPGVFLSAEVTTYFPEDGCKIHILVSGIDENQFRAIQELRANIYELHDYLEREGIIATVNHPFFRVNDRMTVDHVERLLLLFRRFEVINGSRDARPEKLLQVILSQLTPSDINALADRHGILPTGPSPWLKWMTGGSDDHSGFHVASAYTVTPPAVNVEEFLGHLRQGNHAAAGAAGGSVLLAHSLYHIVYSYYRDRFLGSRSGKPTIIGQMLEQWLSSAGGEPSGRLARLVPDFAKRFVWARRLRSLRGIERLLVEKVAELVKCENPGTPGNAQSDDHRVFQTTCHVIHELSYSLIQEFVEQIREGRLIDSVQSAATLSMAVLGIAPYLAAFATQHKDEPFLQAVASRFPAARHLVHRGGGKAWITDTFVDVNGVSRTVQSLALAAQKAGKELTVLTCLKEMPQSPVNIKNFAPVGTYAIPEYEMQSLCFPPFLEVIEHIESRCYDELIISTPGPLGLAGLAAARLLGLRKVGIYHTDLPLVVRHMTFDHAMEQLTRKYMFWFYSQMDRVLAPSEYYRDHLIAMGLEASRVFVMGHGVDVDQFHPDKAELDFWNRFGLSRGFTFVYAGRVSADKNVDVLINAFSKLQAILPDVRLAIVGDGPQLAAMKALANNRQIAFTGFLHGEDLAKALASSDALVFPSTIDTYGLAVLEAQASGLPAVVSNRGGPQEIVSRHGSGIVVDLEKPQAIMDAMRNLVEDPDLYSRCRSAAIHNALKNTWDKVLERMWNTTNADHNEKTPIEYDRIVANTAAELIMMDVA